MPGSRCGVGAGDPTIAGRPDKDTKNFGIESRCRCLQRRQSQTSQYLFVNSSLRRRRVHGVPQLFQTPPNNGDFTQRRSKSHARLGGDGFAPS